MAISKLGAGGGTDYWELISSVTPTGGATAVNFTGLSVYKKLMLEVNAAGVSSSADLMLRLNNDSTSNAYWYSSILDGGNVSVTPSNMWPLCAGTTTFYAYMFINSCDNSGLKTIDAGGGANSDRNYYSGFYKASAVISQVNLVLNTSSFTAAGTVALYGVK